MLKIKDHLLRFSFVVIFSFLSNTLSAAPYTAMYVLGDSLSDTGNIFTATSGLAPASPYYNGRFSDGPVYTDVVAQGLGVSSLNTLNGGTNGAYGGAKVISGDPTPSLTQQAAALIGGAGGVLDPSALYVAFGGANDLRAGDTVEEALAVAEQLATIVSDLISAGAVDVLVPNLPDLGSTPEAGGDPAARAITMAYNEALANALGGVGGGNIIQFDLFGLFDDLIDDPGAFGFTNATDACYTGALNGGTPDQVCATPETYVFWDNIHPTGAAHAIFGAMVLEEIAPVPLPAAVWLFGSALMVLGIAQRRKA